MKLTKHIHRTRCEKKLSKLRNVFYRYARTKSKSRYDVGPLKQGNSVTNDEERMAAILMAQYKDVCSIPREISVNVNIDRI